MKLIIVFVLCCFSCPEPPTATADYSTTTVKPTPSPTLPILTDNLTTEQMIATTDLRTKPSTGTLSTSLPVTVKTTGPVVTSTMAVSEEEDAITESTSTAHEREYTTGQTSIPPLTDDVTTNFISELPSTALSQTTSSKVTEITSKETESPEKPTEINFSTQQTTMPTPSITTEVPMTTKPDTAALSTTTNPQTQFPPSASSSTTAITQHTPPADTPPTTQLPNTLPTQDSTQEVTHTLVVVSTLKPKTASDSTTETIHSSSVALPSHTTRPTYTTVPTHTIPTTRTTLPTLTTLPPYTTLPPHTEPPSESVGCGGTLLEDSGSFSSQNWPETYPVNVDCEWTIELPNTSKIIEITFDHSVFGLAGRMPNCSKDWIKVYDGHSYEDDSWGPLCSFWKPDPIKTTSHRAMVVFHAGRRHNKSRKGFRLIFSSVDGPTTEPPFTDSVTTATDVPSEANEVTTRAVTTAVTVESTATTITEVGTETPEDVCSVAPPPHNVEGKYIIATRMFVAVLIIICQLLLTFT